MKRINYLIQKLASAAIHVAPLAFVVGFLGAPANVHAAPICNGGSVILNSTNGIVGCAFTSWGTAEQLQCNGATVFAPANSGPGTCHVCATGAAATQIAAGNYTGLTVQPAPPYGPGEPTSFACLKCTQPPVGLAAWWTLDDAASGSVADITGNVPLPGMLINNPEVVAGEVGSAVDFNGLNQYIQIPANSELDVPAGSNNGSGDFSIDAWVKLDPGSNTSGVRVIVEKRTFTSPNQYKGYSFYLYNRYLGFQLADNGTAPGYSNYGAPTLVVPQDGKWHFVAASIARGTAFSVQFTLDNQPAVVVNSGARTGSLVNSSPLNIGMITIGSGSVFNGSIDEVEFFHVAVPYSAWQTIFQANCNGKCRP
jgi:hypothetical protein